MCLLTPSLMGCAIFFPRLRGEGEGVRVVGTRVKGVAPLLPGFGVVISRLNDMGGGKEPLEVVLQDTHDLGRVFSDNACGRVSECSEWPRVHALVAGVISEDFFVCLPGVFCEISLDGSPFGIPSPLMQVFSQSLGLLDCLLEALLGDGPGFGDSHFLMGAGEAQLVCKGFNLCGRHVLCVVGYPEEILYAPGGFYQLLVSSPFGPFETLPVTMGCVFVARFHQNSMG